MRRIPHSFCRFYKLCSVHQQKGLHSEKETHIFFIYGSCTCPMRINIAGSPVDRQRVKKSYKRGLSWPPSGPLTPGDALDAGRVDARRLLRPPPLGAFHHHGVLTPPRAAATAARESVGLLARSTPDRSVPLPWPVCRVATAWLS